MKNLILLILVILPAFSSPARAQQVSTAQTDSPKATPSDREQDGLKGLVRRVRIESARILEKQGKPTEGSKELRAIVTYDMQGRKLDTVTSPVEAVTLLGNAQYRYDDKGNMIEKVLRASNGSILGKETYKYEFDELGNWKKMTTSVAVYENGKLGFEPVEITYRTITYYYNEAIEKIAAASKPNAEPTSSASVSSPPSAKAQSVPVAEGTPKPEVRSAAKENATPSSAGLETDKKASSSVDSSAPKSAEGVTNVAAKPSETSRSVDSSAPKNAEGVTSVAAKPVETPTPSAPQPTKELETKAVTEELLRKAAISLPEPEYPEGAELAGVGGKVEVQIIIDEKGDVIAAKSVSGEAVLYSAAEAAALKAHFSPTILSPDPAKVFGVISYNFTSSRPSVPVAQAQSDEISKRTSDNPVNKPASPPTESAGDANSFYQQGLAYLKSGRNSDAVEAFRHAVYLSPQNALAYAELGLAYSALARHEEAIAAFKLAIAIKPDILDAEANYRLGEAYTAIGKHPDALKAFKQSLHVARPEATDGGTSQTKRFPTVADLHFGIGLAYYNTGNYNESIKELKLAIVFNPDLAEAHYGIALAYIARGDRAAAQQEERILRRLNTALADNIAAVLPSVLPPGTTRITPREDRRPRP